MSSDSDIPPDFMRKYIAPHLNHIQSVPFGILWNGSHVKIVTFRDDFVTLQIPYAKQYLTWTFLFDSCVPDLGPDLLVDEEDFLINYTNVEVINKNVPSLCGWNILDDDCLAKVVSELLECYKKYEIQQIEKESLLCREYNLLKRNFALEDIEVNFVHSATKSSEARFFIQLSIYISDKRETDANVEKTTAILLVTYYGPPWKPRISELQLSSMLENLIGNSRDLHIPQISDSSHLHIYVNHVQDLIQKKVIATVNNINTRKNFIAALLEVQHSTVIEFDVEHYRSISLLLHINELYFILAFNLSSTFNEIKVTAVVHSVYHYLQNTPASRTISEYSYNDSVDAEATILKIQQILDKFGSNCHNFFHIKSREV